MKKLILIALFLIAPLAQADIVEVRPWKECLWAICDSNTTAGAAAIDHIETLYNCPGSFCTLILGQTYSTEVIVNDWEICDKIHYQFVGTLNIFSDLQNGPLIWDYTSNFHCITALTGGGCGGGHEW